MKWAEYRCPKCGQTALQRSDVSVFCFGPENRSHKKREMTQGLLGQTQALVRAHMLGEIKVAR